MKRNRIFLLIIIFFSFFFLVKSAFSYTYKIAVVNSKDIKSYRNALSGFKEICIDSRYSHYYLEGKGKEGIVFALQEEKPDLIVAIGSSALEALKGKIKDIPIVFCMVLNPGVLFEEGHIENIFGVSMNVSPASQIITLKEIFPRVKRIGVVYNPAQTEYLISEAREVCNQEGLELICSMVYSQGETINAIKNLENKIDALWIVPDTTVVMPFSVKYMLLFSFRNKIPLFGLSDTYVKRGVLLAVSFDTTDMGRQAGELALQILKKENNENHSLIFARALKLFLNLKTAKIMGFNIPEEMKERVDKIYR